MGIDQETGFFPKTRFLDVKAMCEHDKEELR